MADLSPAINPPKGGGALSGIGEAFQPDLQTGTGHVSVPIVLPKGRNGFQPALTLTYSSGGPNGPFGQGWSLSVPGVQRKTAKGVPKYDGTDVFLLSGSEDLVAVPGAPAGRQRYRPRVEGLFARIEHVIGGGEDYWEVWSREGLVSHYGTPQPANPPTGWQDPAVVVDPAHPDRVFEWLLSETIDPCGNRIGYAYQADGAARYLSEVTYADLVHVQFTYEARPDPTTSRRSGFPVRTALRCTRIQTVLDTLARSVELAYTQAAGNGVSLLTTVQVVGHDGAATQSLPPLELGYSAFAPEGRRYLNIGGAEPPESALNGPNAELVDLFGDGLPGVLRMDGQVRYWRNRGSGVLALPRSVPAAPGGLRLSDSGVQLADMDGDGRAELVVTGHELAGYFPMSAAAGFERFVAFPEAPPANLKDPGIRLIDLTGSGTIDALGPDAAFLNDPDTGWTLVSAAPPVTLGDPRVKVADMTGDGLADLVYVREEAVRYWPSLGYGRFGEPVDMALRLPPDLDPRRLLIGDVDGDGAADAVYVADGQVTVWNNQGGTSFGVPVTVRGTPPVSDTDAVRLADLLGNGTAGILWTYDAGRVRGSNYKFLDLTGGVKPYLLTRMDNHHGAVTIVEYAPSTRFLLDDLAAGQPWATTLPFPVQVVARAGVADQLSGSEHGTTYRYRHGYFDGPDREFRGFARVDVIDSFTLTGSSAERFSTPSETRTWFHIGPVGARRGEWTEPDLSAEYWRGDRDMLGPAVLDVPAGLSRAELRQVVRARHGQVLRTELYGLDAPDRPYTVTEHRHRVQQIAPGVTHPHEIAVRTTQWERGDDPMHRLAFTDGHDTYGRPRFTGTVGVPRGHDPAAPTGSGERCLASYTITDYATRDDTRYMVDRTAATTSLELLDDGTLAPVGLWAPLLAGTAAARLTGHQLTCYDGAPFVGLPLGTLGDTGLVSRAEQLVHTPESLAAVWGATPPDLAAAGYTDRTGQSGYYPGWYAYTTRAQHDAFGHVTAHRDALGHDTTIGYDAHNLLPVLVTDPAGLTRSAVYDYRVLAPSVVTDANGNRTATAYTPLGLPATIATMGKPGEQAGDTSQVPGTVFSYALDGGQPLYVETLRRTEHYWDLVRAGVTDFGPGEADRHPERFYRIREFSDGFGRLLQTRAQGDDLVLDDLGLPAEVDTAPTAVVSHLQNPGDPQQVVVGGWQVYDNKGQVVERYEPFVGLGYDFAPPVPGLRKLVTGYDPRGEVTVTLHPDGSQDTFVRGIPVDLADPAAYRPTAWETYAYDQNDNGGRTHPSETGFSDHWNTPQSTLVDALGHVIAKTEHLPGGALVTRMAYDIDGRLVQVIDTLGRTAAVSGYDLLGRVWLADLIDHGPVRVVLDPMDGAVERQDAKGAHTRREFDAAHREVKVFAADQRDAPLTLREVQQYGDAAGLPDAAARNLLGQPYRSYDEAGLVVTGQYDLHSNAVETTRQVLLGDGVVDWAATPPPVLDPVQYQTSIRFDALKRRVAVSYPQDATGRRAAAAFEFGRAGNLTKVTVDGQPFIERIVYNARAQRSLVMFGNGALSRYAYDPDTFRLARLRSEPGSGAVYQDHGYAYDLVGNLTALQDRTPGCGVPPGPADSLDRAFVHDALYRLVKATGRACAATPGDPWIDVPRCTDSTKTVGYTESYAYDGVGNLLTLAHTGAATRTFTLSGNQVTSLTAGQTSYPCTYDASGNRLTETSTRLFSWNHANLLTGFQNSGSLTHHYRYAADGQRIVKVRRDQGGGQVVTVYVAGLFERRIVTPAGGQPSVHDALRVPDDLGQVALIRVGAPLPGDRTPPVAYQFGDHLGSVAVTVDASGGLIGREEYTPYGETSFGGYALKRYRYTGKERDEDTGLYYHGARYYAPWLARWVSPDPAGFADGLADYAYCRGRPLTVTDPSGSQGVDAGKATGTATAPSPDAASPPPEDLGTSPDAAPPASHDLGSSPADRGPTSDLKQQPDAAAKPPPDLAPPAATPKPDASKPATAPSPKHHKASRRDVPPDKVSTVLGKALVNAPTPAARYAVFRTALQFGKPYEYGAKGMTCWDCSGLTSYGYAEAAVGFHGDSAAGMWTGQESQRVAPGSEQIGDLIFLTGSHGSRPDNPGHVGLVVGDHLMLHAPSTGDFVKISDYGARTDVIGFTRPSTGRIPTAAATAFSTLMTPFILAARIFSFFH